ncbi:hypothetical protein [Marinobacter nauticus]|uniref:hypothetical protein n=1 Tax=Marinobacter nauticus TaxID=2743 RepID=UPI0040446FB7
MTSEAHLIDTSLFRAAIIIPILLGLLLIGVGAWNSRSELELCFEAQCFGNFFSIFKFQFGVMGLAIPLGALIASHHRSIQSAEQIRTQQSQNVFTNHINHKELFERFFRDNNPLGLKEIKSQQVWRVYTRTFPRSAYGELAPDIGLREFLNIIGNNFATIADMAKNELSPTTLDLSQSEIPSKVAVTNYAISKYLKIERPLDKDSILRNPVALLDEFATRIPEIAEGLQSCANFHQIHEEYQAIKVIDDNLMDFSNLLLELRHYSYARRDIINAIENHSTDSDAPIATHAMQRKMQGLATGENSGEQIQPDTARLVFDNYLNQNQKRVFLEVLPDAWRKSFKDVIQARQ